MSAKGLNHRGRGFNNDFVEWKEFRLLLLYMRQYLELFVMFDRMDSNDDRRISRSEFERARGMLVGWGLKHFAVDSIFQKIDQNQGGFILFDEFAHWAIQEKLDLSTDDDAEDAGLGSGLISPSKSSALSNNQWLKRYGPRPLLSHTSLMNRTN